MDASSAGSSKRRSSADGRRRRNLSPGGPPWLPLTGQPNGRGSRASALSGRTATKARGSGVRSRTSMPRGERVGACRPPDAPPCSSRCRSRSASSSRPSGIRIFGRDPANLWARRAAPPRARRSGRSRSATPPGGVDVEPRVPDDVAGAVRHMLGGGFDLPAFAAFAATEDPVLGRARPRSSRPRPALAPDPWEALVTSITAQQVSLRAAFAIRGRLIERYGERHALAYAFPPERLAAARPTTSARSAPPRARRRTPSRSPAPR